jgi:hypothetical protein
MGGEFGLRSNSISRETAFNKARISLARVLLICYILNAKSSENVRRKKEVFSPEKATGRSLKTQVVLLIRFRVKSEGPPGCEKLKKSRDSVFCV